jgi:Ca2+:H+ antiporter
VVWWSSRRSWSRDRGSDLHDGLSETFLGLIIVPIIGNAAEHATAVVVARKGQMDLALQIAMGSSTQVALLVAPLLVLIGLLVGQQMDLVFSTFEIAAVGLTVVVTTIIPLMESPTGSRGPNSWRCTPWSAPWPFFV